MSPVLPVPAALAHVAGKGVDSIERALSLVPRLVDLVSDAEVLMVRIGAVIERTEGVVDRAEAVVSRAEVAVDDVVALTGRLAPLMQDYEPTLTQLQPLLARITDTTDPDEVNAVVTMVNLLPDVVDKFQTDILPVLDTLGTVAPDVRDILDGTKELNELLGALPGLGRVKRRIGEEKVESDAYRANEEPPAAPDRG
jgi:ABC-type transporter Mla subunit MlaD